MKFTESMEKGTHMLLMTRAEERLDRINSVASVQAQRTGKECTVVSEGRTRSWILGFRILNTNSNYSTSNPL